MKIEFLAVLFHQKVQKIQPFLPKFDAKSIFIFEIQN